VELLLKKKYKVVIGRVSEPVYNDISQKNESTVDLEDSGIN
jgi:hypothetical protein